MRNNKIKDGFFEMGYLVKDDHYKLMIPFYYEGCFGLVALPIFKPGQDVPENYKNSYWLYELKRINGCHMVELYGKLSMFGGAISTPDRWQIRFIRCEHKQVKLVVGWLKNLHKNTVGAKENV